MNRRTARENAFIAAFELGFGAQSLEELVEYSEECGEYALDDFAQNLLRCYVEHTAQVDEMIRPRLKNWTAHQPHPAAPGYYRDALFRRTGRGQHRD